MTKTRMFEIAAVVTLATALVIALTVPSAQTFGNLARVLFVHVPAAWLAYLAFTVTLVGSGMYLWKKDLRWDRLASSSAEVGVFFTALAIALGMIWGRSTWGKWWVWDARLVLTAAMLFVYMGYLALRRSIPDRIARARRSAWFGILGVVQIPIVHLSVVWWDTLHQGPTVVRPDFDVQMDPPYLAALLAGVFAFTIVYVVLVRRRIELSNLEDQFETIVAAEEREVAGEAVTAPRYEGSTEWDTEEASPVRNRRPAFIAAAVAVVLAAAIAIVSSQAGSLSYSEWVAFAYTAAYAAMIAYVTWLIWRIHQTRRRVEEVL